MPNKNESLSDKRDLICKCRERISICGELAAIVLHNGYIHCVDEGHRFFTGQVLAEMFSWKDIISVSIGGELHDDYFCIGLKKRRYSTCNW